MITLTPFDQCRGSPEVIATVVQGSFDPAVQEMNYLPSCLDAHAARAYLERNEGVVIRLDGKPIGVTVASKELHPGEGVQVPPGAVELDEWVLAPYRGQGILGKRGWPLISAWLAQRHDWAVSVTWEHNDAAARLLLGRGYRHLGKSFWSEDGMSGWCNVYLYDLSRAR